MYGKGRTLGGFIVRHNFLPAPGSGPCCNVLVGFRGENNTTVQGSPRACTFLLSRNFTPCRRGWSEVWIGFAGTGLETS